VVRPDGVVPSQMVGVSASVNLPLHHEVQKFSSGTGSPGWSLKKGRKTAVVWWMVLVSWSLTSLFSTNMAISETKVDSSSSRVIMDLCQL